MKKFKIVALLLAAVGAGSILYAYKVSLANAALVRELAATRAAIEQAQERQQKAAHQRNQLEADVDRLRQESGEVHRLRAEVSRLTRENAQYQTAREQLSRDAKKLEMAAALSQDKPKPRDGAVVLENAPPPVQASLLREFGSPLPKGVLGSSVDKNGQTTYYFKGQSANGRPAFARMEEDGSVIEKSVDIPTENVPAHVQSPVTQILGNSPISGAREIRSGADVRYELTSKGPDAGVQVAVRGDGTLISYSAVFQPTDKELRNQAEKSQRDPKGSK